MDKDSILAPIQLPFHNRQKSAHPIDSTRFQSAWLATTGSRRLLPTPLNAADHTLLWTNRTNRWHDQSTGCTFQCCTSLGHTISPIGERLPTASFHLKIEQNFDDFAIQPALISLLLTCRNDLSIVTNLTNVFEKFHRRFVLLVVDFFAHNFQIEWID